MAVYEVEDFIGGKWAKAAELGDVKKAKIINEVKQTKSRFTKEDGSPKTQDVGKVLFQGIQEEMNVSFNKATLNGLVKAFGSDSKSWIGQVLSVQTEKVRVGGKANTALYLIPAGFEKVDDEEGYAVIQKIGAEEEIPTINVEDEKEIRIEDVPF